jgi:hypothetical protein
MRRPRQFLGLVPVALLPPAAFAVHQLRYLLAYGSAAGIELQRTGHSYLHSIVPWIIVLIALAVGLFLRALGRAFAGQSSVPRYAGSFLALWLLCAASLVAIYAAQEFLEGLLATGHPAGLVGVFGYGGWWAIPAAASIGLVLAAVFHAGTWVLREVIRRYGCLRAPRALRKSARARHAEVFVPRLAPLVGGWSGRGPPM